MTMRRVMNPSYVFLPRQREALDPNNTSRWAVMWYQLRALANDFWENVLFEVKKVLYGDPIDLVRISQTQDWGTSPIRCISCHPDNPQLLALATAEDRVLIYSGFDKATCLWDLEQKHITCVAFRPNTYAVAVGCSEGVYFWQTRPRARFYPGLRHLMGTHSVTELQEWRHTYVTSLQWNQDGSLLASAALGSSYIILWRPDLQQKYRLIHDFFNRSSYSLLCMSPDSTQLLCASLRGGASFSQLDGDRETETIQLRGRIQTAVWTTCSLYLLFALEGKTGLYSRAKDMGRTRTLDPPRPTSKIKILADLQEVTCSGEWRFCGEPLAMVMDPLGVYLAITFKNQPFVLLCHLAHNDQNGPPEVVPEDFIMCDAEPPTEDDVYPNCMAFRAAQARNPAGLRFLMICWSSMYIQTYGITSQSSIY